jgi:hypothetical protein
MKPKSHTHRPWSAPPTQQEQSPQRSAMPTSASQPRLRPLLRRRLFAVVASGFFLLLGGWLFSAPALFSSTKTRMPPAVNTQRLEMHVRMLSETLLPRDAAHPENLDRVAAYIRHGFAHASATVVDQPFQVNTTTYRNIIARYGPETNERIIVGAHYDVAGPLPGADDNASGVAGLLELATLLEKSDLPRTVELVAYASESVLKLSFIHPTTAASDEYWPDTPWLHWSAPDARSPGSSVDSDQTNRLSVPPPTGAESPQSLWPPGGGG